MAPIPGGRFLQKHGMSNVVTTLQHPLEGGTLGPGFWTYRRHCAAKLAKSPLQGWPDTEVLPENKIPATTKRASVKKLILKAAISFFVFLLYEEVVLEGDG